MSNKFDVIEVQIAAPNSVRVTPHPGHVAALPVLFVTE